MSLEPSQPVGTKRDLVTWNKKAETVRAYGLGLECLNGLDVCTDIVCYRLEFPKKLLSLVDNGLVL